MAIKPVSEIERYIAGFPEENRPALEKLLHTIRKAAPGSGEIISYGIPTFTMNGNLVHFGGFKNHIGFYPAPSAILKFKQELSGYKTAKGSVQFPLNQPLPLQLIKSMVKFRVKENRPDKI